jgi:predicted regulator of Ras-like GTPase activity (Roadblock/LC7/MglB family)
VNSPDTTESDLAWVAARFVEATAGVLYAVVLSGDGLALAEGGSLPADMTERMAAVASGVYSLAVGISEKFSLGAYEQSILRFVGGHVVITALAKGAALAVVTETNARLGVVAHEMALFAARLGENFDPAPRTIAGS